MNSAEAAEIIGALDTDLLGRYPAAAIHGLHPEDYTSARFAFFVARADRRTVGCGGLREIDTNIGEVKRMFVRADYRGRGIARRQTGDIAGGDADIAQAASDGN